ncbi:MAG TPA: hypothetical protein VMS12_09885 [Thermoanaerobaculia bacterium]|nr:hypothetical protein [Thermoanaerobaculia bacterium]
MRDFRFEAIVWLGATGIASAAAFLAARASGVPAGMSEGLSGVAAIILLCGWLVRDTRWVTPVVMQVPLIVAIVALVPQDSLKMLGCGLILAFAIAAALWTRYAGGLLDLVSGTILMVAPLLLFRMVEVPAGKLVESLVIVAGCAVLLYVMARGRVMTPAHWLISFAVGVAVPVIPSRLAAVPLLFAALVWIVRSPRIALPLATVLVVSILAGRWSWPLALAGVAIHLAVRWSRPEPALSVLVPGWWAASLQTVLRPVPFAMAATGAVRFAPAAALGAVAVIAGGALLRPALAILYALAAAVLLVARDESDNPRFSGPAGVIAMLMVAMFAWSGALIGTFPLPVSSVSLAVIVGGAALTMMRSAVWRMSILSLGVLVFAVFLSTGERHWEAASAVLGPGESVNLTPASSGNGAALMLSGGNLLQMSPGREIADMDVISVQGRAYRRTLRVGEISDWASLRQDHWFVSEHGAPAVPEGSLAGHGASSFLIGASSVEVTIPERIGLVRLTMRRDLPDDAMLHVDALRVVVR